MSLIGIGVNLLFLFFLSYLKMVFVFVVYFWLIIEYVFVSLYVLLGYCVC